MWQNFNSSFPHWSTPNNPLKLVCLGLPKINSAYTTNLQKSILDGGTKNASRQYKTRKRVQPHDAHDISNWHCSFQTFRTKDKRNWNQCSLRGVQLRKCAVPPDHLHSEISFLRTCNIPNVMPYVFRKAFVTLEALYCLRVHMVVDAWSFWSSQRLKLFTVFVSTWLRNCMRTKAKICPVLNFLRGNTD